MKAVHVLGPGGLRQVTFAPVQVQLLNWCLRCDRGGHGGPVWLSVDCHSLLRFRLDEVRQRDVKCLLHRPRPRTTALIGLGVFLFCHLVLHVSYRAANILLLRALCA